MKMRMKFSTKTTSSMTMSSSLRGPAPSRTYRTIKTEPVATSAAAAVAAVAAMKLRIGRRVVAEASVGAEGGVEDLAEEGDEGPDAQGRKRRRRGRRGGRRMREEIRSDDPYAWSRPRVPEGDPYDLDGSRPTARTRAAHGRAVC